eukprot:SAG11_NODE_293_length_11144_cov_4.661928_4_plen_67_part_00
MRTNGVHHQFGRSEDLNSRCSDIGELIAQYDFPVQPVSVLVLVLAVPYENLYGSVQSVFADLRYLK